MAPANRLYLARALRDFGDGFVAVLLPVYLSALGFSPAEIGVIATAALLGSALMTIAIGALGSRYDHRSLLLAAAGLMAVTGIAFASLSDFAFILTAALAGTVNPSAGTVSVFVPLEHAVLSRSVADVSRTRAFARYSLIGALAAAAGSLATTTPDFMAHAGLGQLAALKAMFMLYAVLGLAGGLVYARLPAAELNVPGVHAGVLGPSRRHVFRLAALFSLDAFAGGFVVHSLLALWLFERFGLSLGAAGLFFFWSGLLSAFSFPLAAWIARRIGLVNTMVFTHIPASVLLILAAVAPSLESALACLLARAALSQMDVPPRSSYVMAVVTPPERAAAASITAVPRSLAAALSPALAGALFSLGLLSWPLVICGVLKILYDLLLLWGFRHIRPPEEQPAETGTSASL
jgi:MFS family permease